MSDCELRFEYSPSAAQSAFLSSLWDAYAVYVVTSILVCFACLLELRNAEIRPLACFGLGLVAMLWFSWLRAYVWAGHIASSMSAPQMTVRLSDSGIEFSTVDAMSRLAWTAVRAVRRFEDVWVIEQRVTRSRRLLPVVALTPDAREVIVTMVGKAGGSVR